MERGVGSCVTLVAVAFHAASAVRQSFPPSSQQLSPPFLLLIFPMLSCSCLSSQFSPPTRTISSTDHSRTGNGGREAISGTAISSTRADISKSLRLPPSYSFDCCCCRSPSAGLHGQAGQTVHCTLYHFSHLGPIFLSLSPSPARSWSLLLPILCSTAQT